MKLRIAIFEDDQDLLELLQELLESNKYQVNGHLSLKNVNWNEIDIVLGDYRNTLVKFNELKKITHEQGLPLIAISGGDMDYPYQLSKPFTVEELESLMFRLLKEQPREAKPEKQAFFSKLFGK